MTRLAPMVEQNGLRVYVPPGVVFYNDVYINTFPATARMLRMLMAANGEPVSMIDLLETLHHETSILQIRPHLTRVRKALRDGGVPAKLVLSGRVHVKLEWSNQ